jgi:hypothetical protein
MQVRDVVDALATGLARYPSSVATALTWAAVSELTRPGRAKARDTVDGATPATLATS